MSERACRQAGKESEFIMDLIERNKANLNRHPWELSRNYSILKIIKKFPPDLQFVDIGAGDMFFAKELGKITNKAIYAVDVNYDHVDETSNIIALKDIKQVPAQCADCILLLDVLEHVYNEDDFLESAIKLLKDKGFIIITVPAHQFLFSSHDVFLKHYRRYSRKELISLLKRHNLQINENFYFFTIPFLVRCLQKLQSVFNANPPQNQGVGSWKFKETHFVTRILKNVLAADFLLNKFLAKCNISLYGLSICAISSKK